MPARDYKSLNYLKDCFYLDEEYEQGIIWKYRPLIHFQTYRSYRANCGKLANTPAGNKKLYNKKYYYWTCEVNGHKLLNHRVIWMLFNNKEIPLNMIIDHIDRNTVNNHPSNLRLANPSLSAANTKKLNQSGITGVIYRTSLYGGSDRKPYQAAIMSNGKRLHLGCFSSSEKAKNAYDEMFKKLHGVDITQ